MINYKQRYKIIRPYINFTIRNFRSSSNRRRISLYYNSLKHYITKGSTSTSIIHRKSLKEYLKIVNYSVPLSGLKKLPIPPRIKAKGNIVKTRFIIKKNYFILKFNHITLYTTPLNHIEVITSPLDAVSNSFKKLPKQKSNKTFFYSFNHFTHILIYYRISEPVKSLYELQEEFILETIHKYDNKILNSLSLDIIS